MSNNQVYSQYKSRPTLKCLVGITAGGTISFVSKPVGGSTSDKKNCKNDCIVEKSNAVDAWQIVVSTYKSCFFISKSSL
ncbi:hypothetical protein HOLleu_03926 [Holothuria leucospilota]|uniref:DDE Tnp4 domain-containing protein n=1 Tax=Holothuria leucospilota TaxID=206669 RepID=A0A9Q1CRD5_HOLLE|nr:hypothetical protein HOLleu_03926 [Holothuria leucospilota]